MRLTISHREQVRNALIEHAFGPRKAVLQKELLRIGDEIYGAIVGPHVRKMQSMPKDWFQRDIGFEAQAMGHYFGYVEMSQARPLPKERLSIDDHTTLAKRLEKLKVEIQALEKEEREKSRETMNVLAGFSTLEKLVEGWPEIRAVVPESVLAGGYLPVPADVARLTQELGLQPVRTN